MIYELANKLIYLPFLLASNLVFILALYPVSRPMKWRTLLLQGSLIVLLILVGVWALMPLAGLLWATAIVGWWLVYRWTPLVTVPLSLRTLLTLFPLYFGFLLAIGKWGIVPHSPQLSWLVLQLETLGIAPPAAWNALVTVAGGLWCIWGGTVFVRTVLDPYARTQSLVNEEEMRRGRMIGNMERLLIYFLALAEIWSLASVTVAVKAIARFKKLEEKTFAEYFLIGTLASLLYAIGVVFLVRALLL